MRNLWLKFGCFLTGYNYNIVKSCSEITSKEVKRFTSALLIVCILWAFVGFSFSERYLKTNLLGSIIGALIFVLVIIQVERQIMLTIKPTKMLYWSRGIIAVTMSFIGSLIIDQIILKEDVSLKKNDLIDEKVSLKLPIKSKELRDVIFNLDSVISVKEIERINLISDISKNPTIPIISATTTPTVLTNTSTDLNNNKITTQSVKNTQTIQKTSIINPKINYLNSLDSTIQNLRNEKRTKDSVMLMLRPTIESEILSHNGFLDELEVMFRLITESKIALFVWILWVLIILGIELFVLISKMGEEPTDYHTMIKHQMNMHLHKIKLLEPNE